MSSLLIELKKRRLELKFKQSDMTERIGFSKQQYNYLERKGNPRLETLELVAKGLNSEIMLIPQEKVNQVKALLETATNSPTGHYVARYADNGQIVDVKADKNESDEVNKNLDDDIWSDVLSDES